MRKPSTNCAVVSLSFLHLSGKLVITLFIYVLHRLLVETIRVEGLDR